MIIFILSINQLCLLSKWQFFDYYCKMSIHFKSIIIIIEWRKWLWVDRWVCVPWLVDTKWRTKFADLVISIVHLVNTECKAFCSSSLYRLSTTDWLNICAFVSDLFKGDGSRNIKPRFRANISQREFFFWLNRLNLMVCDRMKRKPTFQHLKEIEHSSNLIYLNAFD